jgi:hypothetical protein
MRRIRILDKAAEEAVEAAAWYERQRAGLGADFERAVDWASPGFSDTSLSPH